MSRRRGARPLGLRARQRVCVEKDGVGGGWRGENDIAYKIYQSTWRASLSRNKTKKGGGARQPRGLKNFSLRWHSQRKAVWFFVKSPLCCTSTVSTAFL
jgi:hypothetical protein